MNVQPSQKKKWPRKVRLGRITVSVYRRKTQAGNHGFMVANYVDGKRRFDSYATETDALEAANRLARHLSERDVLSASITRDQAVEFAGAVQMLQPLGVSLTSAVSTLTEAIKLVGDLPSVIAAAKSYGARHKRILPKRVAEIVQELLAIKQSRAAAPRYIEDLRSRLNRFAKSFCKDACNVTTAEIQQWLDAERFSAQGYKDYRIRLHTFFNFAVARNYASFNPVAGVEKIKVRKGDTKVFTPDEIEKLLASVSPEFLPSLAIGAFAGLRSAEIERLEWSDIHLAEGFIVVGASKAKTAGRRVVPISNNLAAWLAPYSQKQGKVWPGTHNEFYHAAQQGTAKAAGIKWKSNALRHSYASYRFAITNDAGRVAGELGNSATVVHAHYRELVNPADGQRWFNVKPANAENVNALIAVPA